MTGASSDNARMVACYRAGWTDGYRFLATTIDLATDDDHVWYQAGFDDGAQQRRDR